MNAAGLVFGAATAAAIGGGLAAAFLPRLVPAALSLAGCTLGVAGMLLVLGADFVALSVAAVLGALLPAALIATAVLAPAAEPDLRPSVPRRALTAVAATALLFALAGVLARTPWPVAGGQRQTSVEWVGSVALSDGLSLVVASAALLGLAGVGVVALLRPRSRPR